MLPKKPLIIIVYLSLLIAFAVSAILLIKDKNGMFYISCVFFFISFTSIFMSIVFVKVKENNPASSLMVTTICIIYFLVTLASLLIFASILILPTITFLCIELILTAIFVSIAIILFMSSNLMNSSVKKDSSLVVKNRLLLADINSIRHQLSKLSEKLQNNVRGKLDLVEDSLRYSDPMSNGITTEIDNDIRINVSKLSSEITKLAEIECEDSESLDEIFVRIEGLISDRNRRINILKSS